VWRESLVNTELVATDNVCAIVAALGEPRIDARQLRYFLAVADELHFGRAAARLHIAQPALSRAIRRLELVLDAHLFERDSRHVVLTPAGAAFVSDARAVVDHLAHGVAAARRAAGGKHALSIGFPSSLANGLIPALVAELVDSDPQNTLELRELTISEQLASLRAGDLDIGFVYPSQHVPFELDGLVLEELRTERLFVALPHGHSLAAEQEITLGRLAEEPWIVLAASATPYGDRELLALTLPSGFQPRVVQEATTVRACLALAASGLGVTVVPESAVDLHRDDLAFVPLDGPPDVVLAAVWSDARERFTLEPVLDAARRALERQPSPQVA
jgi:DNA-binding transcriptional LysR family regulator